MIESDGRPEEPPNAGRNAGLFAIASAVVGLGGVAAAVAMSPWFDWSTDALSDLGHPKHPSAALFGASLLAAGLFYIDAAWTARPLIGGGRRVDIGVVLLIGGGISLAAIGVVNESFGTPHFVVSVTYFALVPAGMFTLATALRHAAPRFALATAAMAAAAAVFGITVFTTLKYGAPFSAQAVPETIASDILAAWAVWAGVLFLRGRFPRVASI